MRALRILQFLLIAQAIRWVGWEIDWSVYPELAATHYVPVGAARWLSPSFPPEFALHLTRALTGVSAALLAGLITWSPRRRWRAPAELAMGLLLALGLFFLDLWHNQFGFIDERIHFVWFALILAFRPLVRAKSLLLALETVTVAVYLQSGLAKLWVSGPAWALEGTTLQIAWIRQGLPLGSGYRARPGRRSHFHAPRSSWNSLSRFTSCSDAGATFFSA